MARNMAMRRLKGHDDVELSTSERVMTPEGFLRAPATIARTGIQEYTKKELNLAASHDIVRLYRPPEEVFSPESMASADGATVTLGHPESDVTAGNWRNLSVGDGVGPENSDPLLRVRALTVRDEWAIYAVIDGVDKISCGYSFDYDETPGITPDGQPYDAIMRNIRINHIAIVYAARCGNECNIADAAHRPAHDQAIGRKANDAERARFESTRTRLTARDCGCGGGPSNHRKDQAMKKINVGGIELQFEGTTGDVVEKFVGDSARAVNDAKTALDAANKRATDAEAALASEKEGRAKDAADHATQIEALKAQVPTPAQLTALVAERTKVVGDAKGLASDMDDAGKSIHEVRVAALDAVLAKDGAGKNIAKAGLGDKEPAKADEAIVRIAFDAVVAAGVGSQASDGGGFQPGLGAALVNAEGKTSATDDAGGEPVNKKRGYARTLEILNDKPRAAT